MENIFSNYALNYYERKLLVTPIRQQSKAPILPKWQNPETYTNYQGIIDKYPTCGIGLLLGESTGIIAVDIDKESAMNLVPPSPVRKKGSKGETRFFRYNGETSKKRHDLGIEILSTGNQTILPPSLHPEGRTYAWVTPDTLLDINVDELPYLDEKFKNQIEIQSFKTETITKSDGTRCNHGSHTKLSEMLVAAIHSNETPEHIVRNLLEYDSKANPEVSYFVCPSRPWKTNDRNLNAYSFVLEGFARHIKNKEIETIPLEEAPVVINLTKKEDLKRKPLPHLRGMGKIMFDHIYENSLVQRSHYMFASIITTTSTILGNRIRLGKTLPNIYSIIIGESGSGKSSSMVFPSRLFTECGFSQLLGDTSPASDTGIIQNLPTQRERLDVIDEGDSLFETILGRNTYGKKMASTYATLYTASGETFGGKTTGVSRGDKNSTGNIGGCYSPHVSMLVGTTPTGFSRYVDQSIIDSGFLARFLYFFDREKKRSRFKKDRNKEIPKEIVSFVKMWREDAVKTINLNKNPMDKFFIKEVFTDESALGELEESHNIIEDLKEQEPEDSKVRSILERAMENLEKLAIIDCALVNYETTDLVLTKDNIEWARKFTLTHIHNTKVALGAHINEGPKGELIKKMKAFIRSKERVSQSELTLKFRHIYKALRNEAITELIETAEVRKFKDGQTFFYDCPK